MKRREGPRKPWATADYFWIGGILLVLGLLAINGGEAGIFGVAMALAGGAMVLIGAIRKGVDVPEREPR